MSNGRLCYLSDIISDMRSLYEDIGDLLESSEISFEPPSIEGWPIHLCMRFLKKSFRLQIYH